MDLAFRATLALAALLAGCAAPAARAPASSAAPAGAASARPAPPPTSPPRPFARDFVRVHLPGDDSRILSISGRDRSDVWLLDEGGTVFEVDGARRVHKFDPARCMTTNVFVWVEISAARGGVRLLGEYQDPNGRLVSATLDPVTGASSQCGPYADYSPLDCRWHHAWGTSFQDGRACALRDARLPDYDPFVPVADRVKIEIMAVSMRGADDGWLATEIGEGAARRLELHRYNGVTWVRVAVVDPGLDYADLWADDAGRAWILVKRSGAEGPATVLLRLDGRALSAVPVPASFAATWIQAAGPEAVWFGGWGTNLFEWDGSGLRQGETPFAPTASWAGPGSELWIVGAKKDELAHTTSSQGAP